MERVEILGVKINQIGFDQTLQLVNGFLHDGNKHLVVTPYSESIVSAQKDEEFRRIINSSDLSVPDGVGLLAAAEFLSHPLSNNKVLGIIETIFHGLNVGFKLAFRPGSFTQLKERVSGTDLVVSLCQIASLKAYRVYFLGGQGGSAQAAALNLQRKFPSLKIESSAGPADLKSVTEEEIRQTISLINQFNPDFLFVAFKPVEQEKWLFHQMNNLNAKVFMAVGGAFDMISGRRKRAPAILRRLNLEWFWRLLIEPSRIGRIFTAVIVFPWLVFREKLN